MMPRLKAQMKLNMRLLWFCARISTAETEIGPSFMLLEAKVTLLRDNVVGTLNLRKGTEDGVMMPGSARHEGRKMSHQSGVVLV